MLSNHPSADRPLWRDLREDFLVLFDRMFDMLIAQGGTVAAAGLPVMRICERTILRVCGQMIEPPTPQPQSSEKGWIQ